MSDVAWQTWHIPASWRARACSTLMSLGAPLSFAAARGAMLNDGLTAGDLILVRYLVAGPLMLPVLFYFGVSRLAGLGWRPASTAGESRYLNGFAPPQTHGDRAVLKAQEWVHMRDGTGVSLAALARAAGLERRTLLRRFASATGMTPIQYSRRVRIARARELLQGGETSQKQIAESLGYKDVASFARAFRKAAGMTPGAYRKRFGGKPHLGPCDDRVRPN
jgi:AraC-like DNA-binding protein